MEEEMKAVRARDLAVTVAARATREATAAVAMLVVGTRRVRHAAPMTGAVVKLAILQVETVRVVAAVLK